MMGRCTLVLCMQPVREPPIGVRRVGLMNGAAGVPHTGSAMRWTVVESSFAR